MQSVFYTLNAIQKSKLRLEKDHLKARSTLQNVPLQGDLDRIRPMDVVINREERVGNIVSCWGQGKIE